MDLEYPHDYKGQRVLERKAFAGRQRGGEEIRNVPICGYVYIPTVNSRTKTVTESVLCYRSAGAGTDHLGHGLCDYHEVDQYRSVSKGLAKDRAGKQVLKEIHQRSSLFGASLKVSPHEALLGELHRTAGIIAWLEEHIVSMVEEDGVDVNDVIRQFTKVTGWKGSVWIEIYQAERKHLVDVASTALKAGVAERQVAIAETQGRIVAMVMLSFIHDAELGLTPAQLMNAPAIVKRHLTALPTATPKSTLVEDLFNDGAHVAARQRAQRQGNIPAQVIEVEETPNGQEEAGAG